MAKRRKKGEEKAIARTRIRALLEHAEAESRGPDADLAGRYARLARRIAMRYQLPLPRQAKATVCRRCGAFRVPGRTGRVRIARGRIVTTCLACGHIQRRPLAARPPKKPASPS